MKWSFSPIKKSLRPAVAFLALLLAVALLRDLLANEQPLRCTVSGHTYYPALRSVWAGKDRLWGHSTLDSLQRDHRWRTLAPDSSLFTLIPFSPGEIADVSITKPQPPGTPDRLQSPRFRHWLGTDRDGRDVAATLVAGARVAVLTGLTAMGMALGVGLLLGVVAGFWGDDRLRVERGRLWLLALGGSLAFAFAFVVGQQRPVAWALAIFFSILLIFNFLGKILSRAPFFSKRVAVPADLLIMRLAEVFQSIPRLLLIVAIAGLAPAKDQSIWLMIGLIGAFSWTSVARFVRAELLRVRALDFVTAARGLGLPEWRVLWRHALPNALRPVLVVLALGMANAVLLEATLSFFGYGREIFKGASWGSLLISDQSGGNQLAYWWVALPPGLAICLTLLALNALGEAAADGPQNQNG